MEQIEDLLRENSKASIQIQTLGRFKLWRSGQEIKVKEWGREVSIQLCQFLITNRQRHSLHREQIIDRIWSDLDQKAGEQNFKVALHGLNKVLDPKRKSRSESKFIDRQGASYQLIFDDVWVDVVAMDQWIILANDLYTSGEHEKAIHAYSQAVKLYGGDFLPNRIYEDWASEERERIQLLILGALINLSELLIQINPMESIRMTQRALQIDACWEDAYRIQMQAYLKKGNRPMALKTYKQCQEVLKREFDIEPLPETQLLYKQIRDK